MSNSDFIFNTYGKYNEIIDKLIYSLRDNTYIDKEDIKQDILIDILKEEQKLQEKGTDNIKNIDAYFYCVIRNKVRNEIKKTFKKFDTEKAYDDEYFDNIEEDYQLDDIINYKTEFNKLSEDCNLSDYEIDILLERRNKKSKNEKSNIIRKIKRKLSK